jgi:spermidine synthase
LLAHPDARYDVIVSNTSYYWRDHSSVLLSSEFLELAGAHLNAGGVFFYNTTGSDDVLATGLHVFPFGLRVLNFLAVSERPIDFREERRMAVLREYAIDDQPVFDPRNSESKETLANYQALVAAMDQYTQFRSLETSKPLNARPEKRSIITDDNMGWESRNP